MDDAYSASESECNDEPKTEDSEVQINIHAHMYINMHLTVNFLFVCTHQLLYTATTSGVSVNIKV